MRFTIFATYLTAQLLNAKANNISCESIGSCSTSDDHNDVCCIMTKVTVINSVTFTFLTPRNGTVQAIDVNNNRKIEYLPVLVYLKFPNLVEYDARNCLIREISKENFERLHDLKLVYLHGNQIEKINSDTFEGLNRLEDIDLARNRIKMMNGQLFKGLPLLIYVSLTNNNCISENFVTKEQLVVLSEAVEKNCNFKEVIDGNTASTPAPIRVVKKRKYFRRNEFF